MSQGSAYLPGVLRCVRALRGMLCAAALLTAGLAAGQAPGGAYAEVQLLLRENRPAEALARAEQYLAGNPRDPQMRFLRGVVLSESGRVTDAIEAFTRLTQDYPELPEPYNNLAVLYAAQDELDKARAALETALRANPRYATAHENLGDIHLRLAARAYGRAAQLDASNAALPAKLASVRQLLAPSAPRGTPERRPARPASP